MLDRVEPMRVAGRIFQKTIARTQRTLERSDPARMLRVDRENQPVEEAASFGGGTIEERVHGRRQPYDAQVIAKCCRRPDALAVDATAARGRGFLTCGRLDARAQCRKSEHAFDFGGDGPCTVALGESQFFHCRAAQSAARRKERNCLYQIGFAGAVGPRQHHRPGAVERNLRGVIAAEVSQRQTSNKRGGHRYSSCRPAPDIRSSVSAQYRRRRWPGQARPSDAVRSLTLTPASASARRARLSRLYPGSRSASPGRRA